MGSNWTEDKTGSCKYGWSGCPHCTPDMCTIYLPQTVRADMAHLFPDALKTVAASGIYSARFNPHGAASVIADDGKWLGVKPNEFRWMHPVPPYDRWCHGKGGLHQ